MRRIKILICTNYLPKEKTTFYRYSDSLIHTKLSWEEVDFSLTPEKNVIYDAILVLNQPSEEFWANFRKGQIFALMQEPGESPLFHPYMFLNRHFYKTIFSPLAGERCEASPPYLGWYFNKSYRELSHSAPPQKFKNISCIASNLRSLRGHRKRRQFTRYLQNLNLGIDFFGKGLQYIANKEKALAPYHYSIAIENSSKNEYFTEKIQDCFLTYTIPLYYGCRNIEKYFPEKSFIFLDIDNYKSAVRTIKNTLENDDYKGRMGVLEEARELVLNRYHVFSFAKKIVVPQIDLSANLERQLIKKERPSMLWVFFLLLTTGYWFIHFQNIIFRIKKRITLFVRLLFN